MGVGVRAGVGVGGTHGPAPLAPPAKPTTRGGSAHAPRTHARTRRLDGELIYLAFAIHGHGCSSYELHALQTKKELFHLCFSHLNNFSL